MVRLYLFKKENSFAVRPKKTTRRYKIGWFKRYSFLRHFFFSSLFLKMRRNAVLMAKFKKGIKGKKIRPKKVWLFKYLNNQTFLNSLKKKFKRSNIYLKGALKKRRPVRELRIAKKQFFIKKGRRVKRKTVPTLSFLRFKKASYVQRMPVVIRKRRRKFSFRTCYRRHRTFFSRFRKARRSKLLFKPLLLKWKKGKFLSYKQFLEYFFFGSFFLY